MHYLAPGKKNLTYHLSTQHPNLLHTEKELRQWDVSELERAHKNQHTEHECRWTNVSTGDGMSTVCVDCGEPKYVPVG